MEQVENLELDDVLDVMVDFPVKPLGRKLIITLNMVEQSVEDTLSLNFSGGLDESQYIIAAGESVYGVEPGMKVLLDIEKLMVPESVSDNAEDRMFKVKVRPIEVDGRVYGLINENVLEAIDLR